MWAEPLNAATNLAFIAAAWHLWRHRAATAALTGRDLALLPLLIGAVGVASGLFHTLAIGWAGALDAAFIALDLLVYVSVFAHRAGGLAWRHAWLAAPLLAAFIAATAVALGALFGAPARGLGLYVAAWLGVWVLAAWSAWRKDPSWPTLCAAACVFALSLTLRQFDGPWCPSWPWGTHFAWHLLNALTLWLTVRAVYQSVERA